MLGDFTIWIDAVCINQANIKGKEHQIPLMAEIYPGARLVYVWLGDGNALSDRAMDYFKKMECQNHLFRKADGFSDEPYTGADLVEIPFTDEKDMERRVQKANWALWRATWRISGGSFIRSSMLS